MRDAQDISRLIRKRYPALQNDQTGGPSLWNLRQEMERGDLVILAVPGGGRSRRAVMEVTGRYQYRPDGELEGEYWHQRSASTVHDVDADELWERAGAGPEPGQIRRWTLFRCLEPVGLSTVQG